MKQKSFEELFSLIKKHCYWFQPSGKDALNLKVWRQVMLALRGADQQGEQSFCLCGHFVIFFPWLWSHCNLTLKSQFVLSLARQQILKIVKLSLGSPESMSWRMKFPPDLYLQFQDVFLHSSTAQVFKPVVQKHEIWEMLHLENLFVEENAIQRESKKVFTALQAESSDSGRIRRGKGEIKTRNKKSFLFFFK